MNPANESDQTCLSCCCSSSCSEDDENGFDALNPEFLAVCVGFLTVMGSLVGYYIQRKRERKEEKEADRKAANDLDRQQALERVRKQLSVFVGPLHRHWKTHNTIFAQFQTVMKNFKSHSWRKAAQKGGRAYWFKMFPQEAMEAFSSNPMSKEAKLFRHVVKRRSQPIYTRIRELVLCHSSDLADMPTQEEWLEKYSRESVTSPYVGSVNVNVILDTFTVWTLEFDDIIQSWEENDFSRMQPSTEVAWMICNDLVDALYDTAKSKEAKYNKHVKIHQNKVQRSLIDQMKNGEFIGEGSDAEEPDEADEPDEILLAVATGGSSFIGSR